MKYLKLFESIWQRKEEIWKVPTRSKEEFIVSLDKIEVYKKVGLVHNPTGKYDYYIENVFGQSNFKDAYKEYNKLKKHGGEAIIVKLYRTQLSEDDINMYIQSNKYNI
jgi:hypothetical protein